MVAIVLTWLATIAADAVAIVVLLAVIDDANYSRAAERKSKALRQYVSRPFIERASKPFPVSSGYAGE